MAIEISGLIIPFGGQALLVSGPDAAALGVPAFGPPAFVRPGYKLVWENDYLLPEQAIDDRGQRFSGPPAAEWIETRGFSFPRADVIGFRPSGEPLSLEMKELDLAVLALFVSAEASGPALPLQLVLDARAVADNLALAPSAPPPELAVFSRAVPFYRIAPGTFGAASAALINRLLVTRKPDWRVTFDDLDDWLDH